MKTPYITVVALLLGFGTDFNISVAAAPLSSPHQAQGTEGAAILVGNCETDENGNTYCSGGSEQYNQPQYKGPSKTQQFLDALNAAAAQAAAQRARQQAIEAEQRRQQKAAERERKKQAAAAAERERKRKAAAAAKARKEREAAAARDRKEREAAAAKDRKERQAAQDAEEAKQDAAKADADQAADDKDQSAANGPACENKTCAADEQLDGDCRCVARGVDGGTDVTTLDGDSITTVYGPTGDLPAPSDLPPSVCEIKIGKTTIYCGGWIPDRPPTRDSCRGVTGKGCYLRTVNVPNRDGGTKPACMQFCKNPHPPIATKTSTSVPPTITTDDNAPGTPAVKTGTATTIPVPKTEPTPAVRTALATPYLEPKDSPTPAMKTATAATYVEPKKPQMPAVKTVIAAPVVEP